MKHEHCCLASCLWVVATCVRVANLESSKLRRSERGDPTLCTHKYFLQVPVKFTVAHWQPSRTVRRISIQKQSDGPKCFSEKALEGKGQEIFSPLWWIDLMLSAERQSQVQKRLISYLWNWNFRSLPCRKHLLMDGGYSWLVCWDCLLGLSWETAPIYPPQGA